MGIDRGNPEIEEGNAQHHERQHHEGLRGGVLSQESRRTEGLRGGVVASPNQVNQPNPNMDSCAAPGVSGSGPGLAAAARIYTVSLFMVSLDTA